MDRRITLAEAKSKLSRIAKGTHLLKGTFVIRKGSEPVGALIPIEEYESMLETLDILETEPDILKKLKKAEAEIKSGKYTVWKPGKKIHK